MMYYIILSTASIAWLGYTCYDMLRNLKRMNNSVQLQRIQDNKKN